MQPEENGIEFEGVDWRVLIFFYFMSFLGEAKRLLRPSEALGLCIEVFFSL